MMMTFSVKLDDNQIRNYFPKAHTIIRTSGTQEGTIVKFENCYLKIYDSYYEGYYLIEEYQFGHDGPINTNLIHINQLREYASRF